MELYVRDLWKIALMNGFVGRGLMFDPMCFALL